MESTVLKLHVSDSLRPFEYIAENDITDEDGNLFVKITEKPENIDYPGRSFEFTDRDNEAICLLREQRPQSPRILTEVKGEFFDSNEQTIGSIAIKGKTAKKASIEINAKESYFGEYFIDAIIPSEFSFALKNKNNEPIVNITGSLDTDILDFEFVGVIDDDLKQLILFSVISVSVPRGLGTPKMLLNQKAFPKERVAELIDKNAKYLAKNNLANLEAIKQNAIILTNLNVNQISNKDQYRIFDSQFKEIAKTKRDKYKSSSKKKMAFAAQVNETFRFLGLDEKEVFNINIVYKLFSNNKISQVRSADEKILFETKRKWILKRQIKVVKDDLVVGFIEPLRSKRYLILDAKKQAIALLWVKDSGLKNLSQSIGLLLPVSPQVVDIDGQNNFEESLLWTIYATPKKALD